MARKGDWVVVAMTVNSEHESKSGNTGIGWAMSGWGIMATVLTAFMLVPGLAHADELIGPRLVCNEPVYDFGTVQNDVSIEHTFLLRNEGDRLLVINRVHTSYGCTTTRLTQRRIQPGGEIELAARLALKGRRGKQHKSIYVRSNDPQSPRYHLELVGEIQRAIEVRPYRIDFIGITGEPVKEKTVHIISTTDKPFKITSIETNNVSFCTISLERLEKAREYELKLNLTGAVLQTGGSLRGKLAVCTDHPDYACIEILVAAFIQQELIVTPNELFLPESSGKSKPLNRFFIVRSNRHKPFEIIGIEMPGIDADATTEKLGAGRYRVQIGNLRPAPDMDGKVFHIRLKNSDGKEQVLDVPVRVQGGRP